ncbi:SixA phosphatase family protein [Mesoterricola sediminis]|nr:histidine phosphatase family protein [Mesoterricola sediminis]
MITILLIRHGIAEDRRPGMRDAERGLTAEGWEKTRAAMAGLVRRGYVPARGVSSPYRRAAETMVCLREATPQGFPVGCWEGLEPEASVAAAREWLDLIVGQAHPFETIALVSHNPFCPALVRALTGQDAAFKKAGCAVLHWTGGRFHLAALFTPAELRGDA